MQNVTGINNGAFKKNRQATSKEDCLCSNEGKKPFVASQKIAKRAMLAKFLKYETLGIKPDINWTASGMTFGSFSATKSAKFSRCPPKLQKASNQLSFSSC